MTEFRNAHFLLNLEATASILTFSPEGRPVLAYRPVVGWLSDPVLSHAEKTGGHSIPYAIPLVLTVSGAARGMFPADFSPKETGNSTPAAKPRNSFWGSRQVGPRLSGITAPSWT